MKRLLKKITALTLTLCMATSLLGSNVWAVKTEGGYDSSILSDNSPVLMSTVSSGTCGRNVTWTLDSSGTLTISGTGSMYDFDSEERPWYDYIDSIKTVVINQGVSSIGDLSFESCENLTRVTIGNSVTSIGFCAFYQCSSLTSVTIPDSVTEIQNGAFSECFNLTEVNMPDNWPDLGDMAFEYTPWWDAQSGDPDDEEEQNTPDMENAVPLTVGKVKTAEISEEGEKSTFSFRPEKTTEYSFYSLIDWGQSTKGYLYNDQGQLIMDYDDSCVAVGDDEELQTELSTITCDLESGKTYYFVVRFGSSDATGKLPVMLKKNGEASQCHD